MQLKNSVSILAIVLLIVFVIAVAEIHPYPKDQPKQYAKAEQIAGNC